MQYDLAKELKDAGFLQKGNGHFAKGNLGVTLNGIEDAYVPTLEEVIEECGRELKIIHQHEAGWMAQGWVRQLYGSTPTEAVARLWLALNPKKN